VDALVSDAECSTLGKIDYQDFANYSYHPGTLLRKSCTAASDGKSCTAASDGPKQPNNSNKPVQGRADVVHVIEVVPTDAKGSNPACCVMQ
jgi:hypothetical protein